jgi:hypothetical protein
VIITVAILGITLATVLLGAVLRQTMIDHNMIVKAIGYRTYQPIEPVTPPAPSPPTVQNADWPRLSTRPQETPLHSELDYLLTDDGSASQPMPPPPRVVSTQETNGTHHTRFNNVCLDIAPDEVKTIQFFNVNHTTRQQFDSQYWDRNSVHWRLYHAYLDDAQSRQFPMPGSLYLPGSTFFYSLAQDNCAQWYQEAICHMPAMIDQQYQAANNLPGWDHLFILHMNVLDANGTNRKRDWTESQLRMIGDTMAYQQSGRPIHLLDKAIWTNYGRPRSICFDSVTVYQPASCQWNAEVSPYPTTLKAAHESHLDRVFEDNHLRTHVPCVQNITIYTRQNTQRRRLMNGQEVAQYLRTQASLHQLDVRVTVLDSIDGDIFAQQRTWNSQEMFISPHSASTYNTMWLPYNGVAIEIGSHGTWYGRGAAPLARQSFFALNYGYQVIPYNETYDNHPHEAERSFRATEEVMRGIFNSTMYEAPVQFCKVGWKQSV